MDNETKLNLKTQALLERISTLTSEYEDKVANLRVELTEIAAERESLKAQLEEKSVVPQNDEVVRGEVETFDPDKVID